MKYNYLAIEGNIGAGKTSLAEMLSYDLQAEFVPERFNDNSFLPRFYQDPDRYALSLELSFLLDRYEQLKGRHAEMGHIVIADYTIDKCLVFAFANLPQDELELFRSIFQQYAAGLQRPDIIIYLKQNVEKLQANIRKRDRNYERGISNSYLEKLSNAYTYWLSGKVDIPVLFIDADKLDFVANSLDYMKIKELLQVSWKPGHHDVKI